MTIRFALCPCAAALALAATPAFADPECLANGKAFQIGQVACLTLSGRSHLARCDMVLNNTSWTKIRDECPRTTLAPSATPISTPESGLVPAEPTEN
ncbi:MAG: hypothetical protein E5X53_26485 [Mesorhizobium sp.]|jgi:hypothetical protein|uniref:hypothetical protein n=1 Tax=Mesorhizobium sp. TaxID=1871066 RepID=UPI000FE61748|nr:hypothetical protein [Mesorhizobium sp.]RWM14474.1 MAG: hypothetical protein EOR73_26675 [Mesorhizobium sp.]TIP70607.1 MAG: hypothetical protein E5X55_26735 [Mesorhizobium sp.]TIQ05313.1 MAG: hypothetical protein E5X57_28305 [Mesorhizobium sp.]TIR49041.1 MAG: hypothetical protein E5X53_26485 [Mesorhizobium sp.]TJV94877.1 MAG: hypothetical protein E5X52_27010 [Mesorhizobium sp.]